MKFFRAVVIGFAFLLTAQSGAEELTKLQALEREIESSKLEDKWGEDYRSEVARFQKAYLALIESESPNEKLNFSYADFLLDYVDERQAIPFFEKAKELNPKNSETWTRLAGIFAHTGPIESAFPYYEEALKLNPDNAETLHDFGTLVLLFRVDAKAYFKCNEEEVFRRAFDLYEKALKLDPKNFELAFDIALSHKLLVAPQEMDAEAKDAFRKNAAARAIAAFNRATTLATNSLQRETVTLNIARWNIFIGNIGEATNQIHSVTNEPLQALKMRLLRSIELKKTEP